ncbi:MAG: hypothetical protein IIY15_05535 [Flavobacteriales bacterium]|nr:hypothetical protein [Flavobacteriales bacterium]
MKNVLTLFVVVMSVVSLAAQSLPENIFKNLSSKGRVSIAKSEVLSSFEENKPFIMREYYDVGDVTIGVPIGKAKVYCQAVVVTSVKTGEKAGFCRISANPKLGLASITGKDRFATIFFTYRELNDCLEFFTYVKDSLIPTRPETLVECRYRTDGMQTITLVYEPSSEKWKISIGGHGCQATDEVIGYFIDGITKAQSVLAEKLPDSTNEIKIYK